MHLSVADPGPSSLAIAYGFADGEVEHGRVDLSQLFGEFSGGARWRVFFASRGIVDYLRCGMYFAAIMQKRLAKAAVIEKLPAAMTPSFLLIARSAISSKSFSARPELPITTCLPQSRAVKTLCLTQAADV